MDPAPVRLVLLLQRCSPDGGYGLRLPPGATLLRTPVRLPLSRARNLMLDHVSRLPVDRPEIIGFVDDDAWYPPGLVEGVLRRFDVDPGLGMWLCRYSPDPQSHEEDGVPARQVDVLRFASSNITHNNAPGTQDGPAQYVAAWRHIRTIFREEGATNAVWVWCPNATDTPAEPWNAAARYYPGDAWVDWVGVDTYNGGQLRSWSTWQSLATGIKPFQDAYGDRKPIMVAETSSAQDAGSKARWVEQLRREVPNVLPSVAALVWFDVDQEEDWRIDSAPDVLQAVRGLAADPYFAAVPPSPTASP